MNSSATCYEGIDPLHVDVCNLLDEMDSSPGLSLKNALYKNEGSFTCGLRAIYAVAFATLNWKSECDQLLKSSQLDKLDWPSINLARIMLTDYLKGKGRLYGNHDLVKAVCRQRKLLRELYKELIPNENRPKTNKKNNVRFCRVNTLKISCEDFISYLLETGMIQVDTPDEYSEFLERLTRLRNNEFMIDYHFKDFIAFSESLSNVITQDEHYINGSLVIQDKSSGCAVFLLNPEPESVVFDMCAAPGMKTSAIAARLQNKGIIYACDINSSRFAVMQNLLDLHGVENVTATQDDCIKILRQETSDNIQYILIDPPCSGSGIRRRAGDESSDPIRLSKLKNLKAHMLREVLTRYQDAVRIVYSTCSLDVEENEMVIDELFDTAKKNGWDLVDCHERLEGFSRGCTEFKGGDKCLYLRPEKDLCNGFFIAVFERIVNNSGNKLSEDCAQGVFKKDRKKRKKDSINEEIPNIVKSSEKPKKGKDKNLGKSEEYKTSVEHDVESFENNETGCEILENHSVGQINENVKILGPKSKHKHKKKKCAEEFVQKEKVEHLEDSILVLPEPTKKKKKKHTEKLLLEVPEYAQEKELKHMDPILELPEPVKKKKKKHEKELLLEVPEPTKKKKNKHSEELLLEVPEFAKEKIIKHLEDPILVVPEPAKKKKKKHVEELLLEVPEPTKKKKKKHTE